uniref:Sodium-dependent lysophosphatidylcholine symporter 1-B n=1 Tax=Astyanax mexicanus TaxID=7994 RepID=A0A8B9KA96_ASTMX
MARGEGAEQFPSSLLPSVKHINKEGLKTNKTPKEKKECLSICSKLCYAIGGAPYQITGSALGFFLQMYLLDVAQLDPFYASIILFVGRIWDAITDPTVGFLVSRSPWTRRGRMMPWIVLSTPLAVISYFLIWVVPPFEKGKVVWYLIFYCLFQSMQTCFHVPYSALTMFISSEQKERDSATAYRMTIEVLGTVVGTAIQGQIVGGANAQCINHTTYLNGSNIHNPNGNASDISLDDTVRGAYMIASGVISAIYILCAIVLFLGVREQKGEQHSLTLFIRTHTLMEGNFALFITYTLGFRDDFQNILLVIMLSGSLTIPLWQMFLTRFGKKTAVYIGISWAIPFMIIAVCLKSNLILSYVVAFAAGISVAAAFLLPWSMLPDVVDDFKVNNPNSQGHEAIFYSFYVFFTKFASGVSLGVSTLCLHFAGYVARGCNQPDSVHLTLKLLVSAAPVSLIILGLIIFKTYPINEKRRQNNWSQLQVLLQ